MRGITLQFLSGLAAGLLAAAVILIVARRPPGQAVVLLPPPTVRPVRVYVTGAVARPGVYALPPGSIWQDALTAAGGSLPAADLNAVNLAQPALDGDQVDLPGAARSATPSATPRRPKATPTPTSARPASGPATAVQSTPLTVTAVPSTTTIISGAVAPPAAAGGLVNLNTATLADLDALPGVGPSIAQRILDYRAEHGPFQQLEDLLNVKGIGESTFNKLKALITLGP